MTWDRVAIIVAMVAAMVAIAAAGECARRANRPVMLRWYDLAFLAFGLAPWLAFDIMAPFSTYEVNVAVSRFARFWLAAVLTMIFASHLRRWRCGCD